MKNRAFDYSGYELWIDPSECKPYEKNIKIHTSEQIDNIAISITKYGWQQDCVLTKDNVVVIGHGRRLAAIKLGCKMPYHVIDKNADSLTEKDIRELRIVDNMTNSQTGYDIEIGKIEIPDLVFEDFNFDLSQFLNNELHEDYINDFFDRGVEAKEKPVQYALKLTCGSEQELNRAVQVLTEAGFSPEVL